MTLMLGGLKPSGTLAVAVPDTLVAASPTLHLADQAHQPQQQDLAFHHSLSGQLSQHAELSQGSYPPWLLQNSNPGLCIPDSLGTQSPLQRDRQLPAITAGLPMPSSQQPPGSPEQPAAANVQQQEAHKRKHNAAVLQELMTQADASEPDADDFVADSAADHDPANAGTIAEDRTATALQPASIGAAHVAGHVGGAQPSQAAGKPAAMLPAEHAVPAEQRPQGSAEGSRGAGTPAGPQEEFYSPQEHFHSEATEQHDVLVHAPNGPEVHATAADQTRPVCIGPEVNTTADDQTRPVFNGQDVNTVADDQTRPAPPALTPLNHKTPAPTKRRKGSKRYLFVWRLLCAFSEGSCCQRTLRNGCLLYCMTLCDD